MKKIALIALIGSVCLVPCHADTSRAKAEAECVKEAAAFQKQYFYCLDTFGDDGKTAIEAAKASRDAAEKSRKVALEKVKAALEGIEKLDTESAEKLQKVRDGADKVKATKEKLELLKELLEDSEDPAAALDKFNKATQELVDLVTPLIGELPLLGDLIDAFKKAMDTMVSQLKLVQELTNDRRGEGYAALEEEGFVISGGAKDLADASNRKKKLAACVANTLKLEKKYDACITEVMEE